MATLLNSRVRHIAFLVFLLCIQSCSFFQPKQEHIPPEKMMNILADMHMAEVYSTMTGRDSTHKNQEKNMDSLAHYYKEILAHHHITIEDFNKSADWYRANADILDTTYNNMLTNISALKKK